MTRRWLAALVALALLVSGVSLALSRPDPMLAVVLLKGQPGHGTGFAVGPHTVVTNRHVVEDRRGNIRTLVARTMLGGEAVVERAYLYAAADIAILSVSPALPHSISVYCGWPRRGMAVQALGHPLGTLWGAFSGRIASDLPQGDERIVALDVGVNHGMSGGAVVDWRGRVVAMVMAFSAVSTGGQATGLAVPGDAVCDALEQAKEARKNAKS